MLPGQMAQYQRAATVALHSLAVFHTSEILGPHAVLFSSLLALFIKPESRRRLDGIEGLHVAFLPKAPLNCVAQRRSSHVSSGASYDLTSDSCVTVTRSKSPLSKR